VKPIDIRSISRWPARALAAATAAVATGALVVAAPATAAPSRVANPYDGAQAYVDPQWSANAGSVPGGAAVADQPTAVWLDRMEAITGAGNSMGLADHLDEAVAQQADVIQLVLYNIPGRDCDRLRSDGQLSPDDLHRYQDVFIDPIAEIIDQPQYADLRVVVVVEPHALANLVTHVSPYPTATYLCEQALVTGLYTDAVGYALARLSQVPNVYSYLDLSHHGQLGWTENALAAVSVYGWAATSNGSDFSHVHGFVANTANYSVLDEEFFNVDDVINGVPVYAGSSWVDWNNVVDEIPYVQLLRPLLLNAGFDSQLSMLIDTSRNGWGGKHRPTGPGPQTTAEEYVEASRIDRRIHIRNWCNQEGAGLGERPTASPVPGVDAYVWIKPPGESDGASYPHDPTRKPEPMCDPLYLHSDGHGTGALPGAPPAGQWFPAFFAQLLDNAWPPL
jgi:cellulose 1,4-beta-cellobiosidase